MLVLALGTLAVAIVGAILGVDTMCRKKRAENIKIIEEALAAYQTDDERKGKASVYSLAVYNRIVVAMVLTQRSAGALLPEVLAEIDAELGEDRPMNKERLFRERTGIPLATALVWARMAAYTTEKPVQRMGDEATSEGRRLSTRAAYRAAKAAQKKAAERGADT